MNIEDAIQLCLDHVGGFLSENTARTYEGALKHFEVYLKEYNIDTRSPLSAVDMELFIRVPNWLMKNFSKKTALVYLSGIRSFMEWMILENHLDPTYREQLRFQGAVAAINRKQETKMQRFPEEDDVDRMLEAARQLTYDPPIPERNIAFVEFLASTGCRVSEACKLTIKDLDSKTTSAIVDGKGSKERRVFINRRAREALRHYWKVRGFAGRNDPVFTRHDKRVGRGDKFKKIAISTRTADNIVTEIAVIAGVEQFTPHYFRHAFAIKALQKTGNLALVQDLLGHASPTATRVYAKIRPKDLEKAHREVFG